MGKQSLSALQQLHVAAWAARFLFPAEQLNLEMSALSGGEQARVRIGAHAETRRPAPARRTDERPRHSLAGSTGRQSGGVSGAVVLVTHDRDLMDRLCTEFIGLDGKGGRQPTAASSQWLTAYDATSKRTSSRSRRRRRSQQSPLRRSRRN